MCIRDRYTIVRAERRRATVVRRLPNGGTAELARSERLWGIAWPVLAHAILHDALGKPPSRKLARDYSHFLVLPKGGSRVISGQDVQDWLATWQPPLSTIFGSRR